jgi:hypothetical protein
VAPSAAATAEEAAYEEFGSEFDESDFGGTGIDVNSMRSTAQKIYAQSASAGSAAQHSAPLRSSYEPPQSRDNRNDYTQLPSPPQQQQQMPLPQPPPRARGSSRGSAQDLLPPAQPPRSNPLPGARPPQLAYFDGAGSDGGPVSPPYSSLDDADYLSQTSTIQSQSTYRSQQQQRNQSDLYPGQRGFQPAATPAATGLRSAQQPASSRRDLHHDYATPQHDPQRPQSASSYSSRGPPSEFAQHVVQDLGVDNSQAAAAMSVIDKVAQITDAQLAQLDPATRSQILQIRSELGLGGSAPGPAASTGSRHSAESRPQQPPRRGTPGNAPSQQGIRNVQYYDQNYSHPAPNSPPPQRASSAPRQRAVSSGSASLLSQQSLPPRSTPAASSAYGAPRGSAAQGYGATSAARPAQLPAHYQDYPPQRGPPASSGRGEYGHYVHYADEDDDNFSQLDML